MEIVTAVLSIIFCILLYIVSASILIGVAMCIRYLAKLLMKLIVLLLTPTWCHGKKNPQEAPAPRNQPLRQLLTNWKLRLCISILLPIVVMVVLLCTGTGAGDLALIFMENTAAGSALMVFFYDLLYSSDTFTVATLLSVGVSLYIGEKWWQPIHKKVDSLSPPKNCEHRWRKVIGHGALQCLQHFLMIFFSAAVAVVLAAPMEWLGEAMITGQLFSADAGTWLHTVNQIFAIVALFVLIPLVLFTVQEYMYSISVATLAAILAGIVVLIAWLAGYDFREITLSTVLFSAVIIVELTGAFAPKIFLWLSNCPLIGIAFQPYANMVEFVQTEEKEDAGKEQKGKAEQETDAPN